MPNKSAKKSNDLLKNDLNFSIEKYTYSQAISMPKSHYHSHYELLYFTSGCRKLIVNEFDEYPLDQYHFALIRPYTIHKTIPASNEVQSRILINVSTEFVDNITRLFSQQIMSCFNYLVVELDSYTKAIITRELMKLYNNSLSNNPNEDAVLLGFSNIVYELSALANSSQQNPFVNANSTERIHEITKYIEEHISGDLSLTHLSDIFHISPEYLSRSFKISIGTNISKYISNMRLIYSKRLLENKALSIEYVATHTGFSSVNHFDKVFKKAFGYTPKQYQTHIL